MDISIQNKSNKTKRRRNRRRNQINREMASTQDGLSFLKCAFAAPDFESDAVAGVPDEYNGRTICKKHRFVGSQLQSTTYDTFFLLLPTPGVAYWFAAVTAGSFPGASTQWTPVYYGDTATLFPQDLETTTTEKFRYISNSLELICTSNATQWAGSLTAWKFPISIISNQDLTINPSPLLQAQSFSVTGLQSTSAVGPNNYCTPSNMGIFINACHEQPSWQFQPILNGLKAIPQQLPNVSDYGQLNGRIMGMGNLSGVCVRISASTTNFVIKTWACIEYMVNTNSTIYDYTRTSPAYDPVALLSYKTICNNLPIAVDYFHNESFWQRILAMFMNTTKAASVLPGAPGAIAAGLNMVGEGMRGLFL